MIRHIVSFGIRYLFIFVVCLNHFGCSKKDQEVAWMDIISTETVWTEAPDRLRTMLKSLDYRQPGLVKVQSFLVGRDTISALESLLQYYGQINRDWVVTTMEQPPFDDLMRVANAVATDSIYFERNFALIPKTPYGGWQWNYTGPAPDDEFGYTLNGHRYMMTLIAARSETGSDTYVRTFDKIIRDWIIHHPLPEAHDSIYLVLNAVSNLDYRDIGEVEWRTIQAGQRLGDTWPQAFYAFQKEKEFSKAARLLMLCSISEQAGYLRKYHKKGHNWTTMEMNGLALAGLAFPEFKDAEDWAGYALEVMSEEINRQVYPDGVQTEISTKTQWVALQRFESLADNFDKAGRELPPSYHRRLQEMYNYLAFCMRPDGHQPLNSDSDREDLRERVVAAATKYGRPDWVWVATNGQWGVEPQTGPSLTFPWAGIHIMRSGWEANAGWSFFDNGPYGTGHQHRDKLHLSIAAYGKDLLVDGGRYTHQDYFSFDPSVWRGYFRSSYAHNVILVDGNGQRAGATMATAPLVDGRDYIHRPGFDYAYGVFTDGFEEVEGIAVHIRSVLYIQDRLWLVLDQIKSDQPRELQALWHYAPGCEVIMDGIEAVSVNRTGANLRIMPIGMVNWKAEIINGQEEPVKQGWYSGTYGVKEPNPTVVYTTTTTGSVTFAWLIVAANGEVPKFSVEYLEKWGLFSASVSQGDQYRYDITMPFEKDVSKVWVSSK
jgi:hypothetical protein